MQKEKKIFLPRKVKMFGFGHFPREIFARFIAKQKVSFTDLAPYPPPKPKAKPNPALFMQGYPAPRVAPNRIGDAGGSCRSPRRAVLGDKTKARQQAGGGEGCWRRETVHGGPRDAEPSTPVPGTGKGIGNWQPGLGCPFCGVLFNCTG